MLKETKFSCQVQIIIEQKNQSVYCRILWSQSSLKETFCNDFPSSRWLFKDIIETQKTSKILHSFCKLVASHFMSVVSQGNMGNSYKRSMWFKKWTHCFLNDVFTWWNPMKMTRLLKWVQEKSFPFVRCGARTISSNLCAIRKILHIYLLFQQTPTTLIFFISPSWGKRQSRHPFLIHMCCAWRASTKRGVARYVYCGSDDAFCMHGEVLLDYRLSQSHHEAILQHLLNL